MAVERYLHDAASSYRHPRVEPDADLSFGVDLGTATVALTAVTSGGEPAYYDELRTGVVRDGVVVDFAGAVAAVRELVGRAEELLRARVRDAAAAYPPGVGEAESRACRYVLENAGVNCRRLVDEVSAAQALLGVRDGAIADVGGGSTGVGVYRDGSLVSLGDRPGGGAQLNLILAGALSMDVAEAEERKRAGGNQDLSILGPGIERIADNIRRLMGPPPSGPVHLIGGTMMYPGAGPIVARYIGHPVAEYAHALLVTPFGIALS